MHIRTTAEAVLEAEVRISSSYKRQRPKDVYVDEDTKAIWQGGGKHGLANGSMGGLARLTLEATVHPLRAGFRANLPIETFKRSGETPSTEVTGCVSLACIYGPRCGRDH